MKTPPLPKSRAAAGRAARPSQEKPRSSPLAKADDAATHSLPPPPAPIDKARESALLQVEDEFYTLLSGETRFAMLVAMVELGLAELLLNNPALTQEEIVNALNLHRGRGQKWVLLLESVGLLLPERDSFGVTRYTQAAVCRALVDKAAPNHFFYRDFLRYFRIAAKKDLTRLLHGEPVPESVRYPPVLWEDVVLLHDWMRDGALTTLSSIERRFDFGRYQRILDVAGGDATMATTLARRFPSLQLTVFNLPAAATLCRQTIAAAELQDRVQVAVGDFRTDALPVGFELVMFSRVMADWSPAVCRMLMQKAHAALLPGGQLLIAEPLRDENPALAIAWEHSYLPYDDFGAAVYKRQSTYVKLLTETGFRLLAAHPRSDTIHSVLIAERL